MRLINCCSALCQLVEVHECPQMDTVLRLERLRSRRRKYLELNADKSQLGHRDFEEALTGEKYLYFQVTWFCCALEREYSIFTTSSTTAVFMPSTCICCLFIATSAASVDGCQPGWRSRKCKKCVLECLFGCCGAQDHVVRFLTGVVR